MVKPLLIGIHGKPHSGKDTIADYLVSKYNFFKYGPSVRVKMTAAAMFDVPFECFVDEKLKEQVDPFWGISYREMAQKVGKESSRDVFGEDFWMRHVGKMIDRFSKAGNRLLVDESVNTDKFIIVQGFVLADIRYANEAQWVKDNGGVVIFVSRNDEARGYIANASHPAEQGIHPSLANHVITNDETIEDLYRKIDNIIGVGKGFGLQAAREEAEKRLAILIESGVG